MKSAESRHIALFLPSLGGGGAEKVMTVLANEFAARDLRVDLLLAQAEGPYISHIDTKVKIWDFGKSRVVACVPALARYLKNNKPHVLLSALYHANVAAVVSRSLSGLSSRLVLSEHTTPSKTKSAALRDRLAKILIRWCYPLADAVVAVSRGVSDDIASYGVPSDRRVVVYNPIIDQDFVRKSNEACFHPWLNESVVPVVIGVGRLEEAKGFDVLLKAFAVLRRTTQCRLLLLGEGSQRKRLQELAANLGISEHLQLLGFVSNPYPWMRSAKTLVVPSRWEGFGNVVVEGLACGTKVVSTDCAGPREILLNGDLGTLVPVNNVDLLASAIKESLRDTEPLSPVPRDYIESFSVEQSVRGYLNVLFN